MTNDFVTVTIYGHKESVNTCLLPYISEEALVHTPATRMKRTRKTQEKIEAELNTAQLRFLIRDEKHAGGIVKVLASSRTSTESSSRDALSFELGYLAGKLALFRPSGL